MRAAAPAGAAVVVVVDAAPATDAVHWAAREAARRCTPLRILVPTTATADERGRRLVDALTAARRTAPDTAVQSVLSDEPLGRTARTASADAALVVLAGPSTAVDELVAVRTWHHPLVDLGLLTGDRIAHWDAAHTAQRQDLADRLGLAALAHPEVPVRMQAVDDSCADLLAALARRARLPVVGRPARGSVLGRVRPSPAVVMARLAPAPSPSCRRRQRPGPPGCRSGRWVWPTCSRDVRPQGTPDRGERALRPCRRSLRRTTLAA